MVPVSQLKPQFKPLNWLYMCETAEEYTCKQKLVSLLGLPQT